MNSRTVKRKISIAVLICMMVVMLSPIMAYASFYYNNTSGKLSGGVYVNDPSKVKVTAITQNNSVTEVTYISTTSNFSGYDDNNVIVRTGEFGADLPANQAPSKIMLSYCNQSYELLPTRQYYYGTVYDLAEKDEFRSGYYRATGNQYFTETAGNSYLQPGTRLVDFTPTGTTDINRFQIYFPYDTQIDLKNIDITDFKLTDVTVSQDVYLQSMQQLYNSVVRYQAQPNFIAGHKYELTMSNTSLGNEVKLPVSGIYNNSNVFFDQSNMIIYFDNIQIGNAVVGGTPSRNDGGAPFGDMSKCSVENPGDPPLTPSTPPTSSTSSAVPTPSPAQTEDWITANAIGDKQSKIVGKVTKEADKDGQHITKISLDQNKFKDALQLLKGKIPKEQILQMALKSDENNLNVIIPLESLTDAIHNTPDGVISIGAGSSKYDLPIHAIDPEKLAKKMNVGVKDLQVTFQVANLEDKITDAVSSETKKLGASMLAKPYHVSVTLDAQGNKTPLEYFENAYVVRSLTLPSTVDSSKVTGVGYGADGKLSFVPVIFHNQNGQTEASFKSNRTGIFTLIELKKSFKDLDKHWAQADIELLATKLVVNGSLDNNYVPNAEVTRAEFAALLARSLGLPEDSSKSNFKDVSKLHWSAGAIGAAVKAGLVDGFEDGTFQPNSPISREQMAAMITKAQNFVGKDTDGPSTNPQKSANFTDQASISPWAQRFVEQAIQAGLITGTDENLFAPTKNATRAEAATIVKRFLQKVEFIN